MLHRRWPLASKIAMVLGVALGAVAFVVVRGYQDRVEALRPAVGPIVTVAIAARGLVPGTTLTAEDLRGAPVPSAYVPPGAVRDAGSVVGRVLTAGIDAGEVLTRSRLAAPRVGPIAALVPDGLRAIAVPTDLPPGIVRAGDRVEVFATYGGGRAHTELVASGLETVRVLDAASPSTGIAGSSTTTARAGVELVLLVDADTAERLAFARTFGQLEVTILGPETPSG